jgi:hypothetical protein
MVAVVAESMVGGTIFHRKVIQREITRVLLLNLSGKTSGACAPPRTTTPLTTPSLLSRATRQANYGIMVDIEYQVWDQNHNEIQSGAMIPYETGTMFGGGNLNGDIGPVPGYPTSSKTTSPTGTFYDVPFGGCANGAFSQFTAQQNITMVMPNGSSSPVVRSQTFTLTGKSAGHGTLTNGSDISATR